MIEKNDQEKECAIYKHYVSMIWVLVLNLKKQGKFL